MQEFDKKDIYISLKSKKYKVQSYKEISRLAVMSPNVTWKLGNKMTHL